MRLLVGIVSANASATVVESEYLYLTGSASAIGIARMKAEGRGSFRDGPGRAHATTMRLGRR